MKCRAALLEDNVSRLEQGIALLEQLDDELYARPETTLALDSVGGHVRHCIDFYQRFLDAAPQARVDYDLRERDRRLETDRAFALSRLRQVIDGLRALVPALGRETLEVKSDAAEQPLLWARSSVERELLALASHTLHHFALMAVVLRASGFPPGDDFGVAPSTLRHWQQERPPCAR